MLVTSCRKRVSLSHDAVLNLATLRDRSAVAYDAPDEVAALLYGNVVHDDAIGETNLLLDNATGAEDGILEGGLVRHAGSFTHKALGADLRLWPDGRARMEVDGVSVGGQGWPEAGHLSVQLAEAVQGVGPVAGAGLLDESVAPEDKFSFIFQVNQLHKLEFSKCTVT